MPAIPQSPLGRILARHATVAVTDALADTRVVLVNGARQCGKSTLIARIGSEHDAQWRSLDHAATRQSAAYDPTEFVRSADPLVIDEVQRVPELFLAIKELVDTDPRPGRFLLTGSAHVLALRGLPDALPGRMETIELWPLSQGEIDEQPDGFIDAIFTLGPRLQHTSTETRASYIDRLTRGGFPEAVARTPRRRERFLDSYVSDLINRDVIQLSEIERGPEMRTLTRLVAARSGQLLVPGSLGNATSASWKKSSSSNASRHGHETSPPAQSRHRRSPWSTPGSRQTCSARTRPVSANPPAHWAHYSKDSWPWKSPVN
jgi:predicted AAA+ superfamily ATPase